MRRTPKASTTSWLATGLGRGPHICSARDLYPNSLAEMGQRGRGAGGSRLTRPLCAPPSPAWCGTRCPTSSGPPAAALCGAASCSPTRWRTTTPAWAPSPPRWGRGDPASGGLGGERGPRGVPGGLGGCHPSLRRRGCASPCGTCPGLTKPTPTPSSPAATGWALRMSARPSSVSPGLAQHPGAGSAPRCCPRVPPPSPRAPPLSTRLGRASPPTEDFRLTAARSLLKVALERAQDAHAGPDPSPNSAEAPGNTGGRGGLPFLTRHPHPHAPRVPWRGAAPPSLTPRPAPAEGPGAQLVEEALRVCGQHLGSLTHRDIDGDPRPPSATDAAWDGFLRGYYRAVQ